MSRLGEMHVPEADAAFEASDFDFGAAHGRIDEAGLAEGPDGEGGQAKALGLGSDFRGVALALVELWLWRGRARGGWMGF